MPVPERLFAHASPPSIGGVPLFDLGDHISRKTVSAVASHPRVVHAARLILRRAGFEILHVSPVTINFAGPPELFERVFRTKIVEKEVPTTDGVTTTFLDSPDTDLLGLISTAGTPLAGVVEGVALEAPRNFFNESPIAPPVSYWHLRVPGDVAVAANAAPLHQYGILGQGIRVAMVDSGWYDHSFFRAQGYNVRPTVLAPGAVDPEHDESGHGTGESANILAIAPECELFPVKMNFVNTVAAFNEAVALAPHIITCSWGSNSPFELSAADMVLASSVSAAVAAGITVIFAAGNGHAGFPGQHPDVISVGGAFMRPDGSFEASDYSSAFSSLIYPGREVPDVCGLVGMRPKAIYIMLPVEPGCNIDTGNAGPDFPDGDETEPDDGWAAFSGTSAAAPQMAGVAALMKQVAPGISPLLIRAILMYTARDVTEGVSGTVSPLHAGLPAGPGPDPATGPGVVDAYSAVTTAFFGASAMAEAIPEDPLSAYLQALSDPTSFAHSHG